VEGWNDERGDCGMKKDRGQDTREGKKAQSSTL